ncbi:MAG: FIG00684568: hypothetical protein, partial [uncultured Gemmatimonadaceae bacterium]
APLAIVPPRRAPSDRAHRAGARRARRGDHPSADPRRRRRARGAGRARRGRPPLHRVARGRARRLAPHPARAPGEHPVRQHAADPRGGRAAGCAAAAHLLRRADHRRELRAHRRALLRLREGRGRERVRAALPLRRGHRRRDPAHRRRPLAERRRALEHRRHPHGLREHAPQRRRPRPVRDEPARPAQRPAGAAGERGRVGGVRLVARRPPAARERVPLGEPERAAPRRRGHRPPDAAAPRRARHRGLRRGAVRARRARGLSHHRQGGGVPAAGLPRPRHPPPHDAHRRHPVGRGGLRPLARWAHARLRDQRGRRVAALPHGHRHPPGAAGGRGAGGGGRGRALAPRLARGGVHRGVGPQPERRVLGGPRHRARDALDRERAGRARGRGAGRARAGALAELRRARDQRLLLPPARALRRQAPRAHQHPRRPRGAVAPRLPGAHQLLHQRAGRGRDLPERPRLHRLRQDVREARQRRAARGLGEGHRRAARLGGPAARARRRPRDGHRRQLRRLHDARGGHHLQRPHLLLARRGGDLELQHLPQEHRELPARPAPRRVRRRARPAPPRLLREDRPAQQRAPHHQAALRGAGRQRPARAAHGGRADGGPREAERQPRLVPHGHRRGARLPQEGERRLPVLRHHAVRAAVPAARSGARAGAAV